MKSSPKPEKINVVLSDLTVVSLRMTAVMVFEIVESNGNGDPDLGGAPRIDTENRGIMLGVSFKAKIREILANKDGPEWKAIASILGITDNAPYGVYEHPTRSYDQGLKELAAGNVLSRHIDLRLFGAMINPENKSDKAVNIGVNRRGAFQFGVGRSLSPIFVHERTVTRRTAVQEGKERGMAPMAAKTTEHALFTMTIYASASACQANGVTATDVAILKLLLPKVFELTRSVSRTTVNMLHVHWIEHENPLGNMADHKIVDALMPKRKNGGIGPSRSMDDYDVPASLANDFGKGLTYADLCNGKH